MATVEGYHFDQILNFRDVGAGVNAIERRRVLQPGRLFRTARIDHASAGDREQLQHQYKIKTMIDLRSKTELLNATGAPGPQIAGIAYTPVNLNGRGFERHLIWQLKYVSLAKMVLLMALGYRTEGIAVLGRELMLPRGLVGLGIDTLDHSGPEIRQVFDVLADPAAWPVMVNCTQGKDRTGIVILLVLLLCGVGLDAAQQDYQRSEVELESEMEARMQEIESIGLDESFARCPADFCPRITEHLAQAYGGLEQYLESIGVDVSQQEAVKLQLKA